MDFELVMAILKALEAHQVAYKVVGGVAMSFHGLARGTRDLDLFVRPDADNVARLRSALGAVFDDPDIAEITAADLGGRYPAIQYVPPVDGFHIDILARLGEAFAFEDIEHERREVAGVSVPVATARMLYRMKKDTVRPRDRLDAAWLRTRLDPEEG